MIHQISKLIPTLFFKRLAIYGPLDPFVSTVWSHIYLKYSLFSFYYHTFFFMYNLYKMFIFKNWKIYYKKHALRSLSIYAPLSVTLPKNKEKNSVVAMNLTM